MRASVSVLVVVGVLVSVAVIVPRAMGVILGPVGVFVVVGTLSLQWVVYSW